MPIELSPIAFTCTPNALDTIPPPLLNRYEVNQFSGYTHDENRHITRHFLLPGQLA
jgi:ATP-dependent Lon protease